MNRDRLYENLGAAIRKARQESMLKQLQLAKELGVVSSHLSDIEHGKKAPSIELLDKLERRLGSIWINR